MKIRALVVAVVAAGSILSDPAGVQADKLKPPVTSGILQEDSTCPAATHSFTRFCVGGKSHYLVFDKIKGAKHFLGYYVAVSGPIDTTSCPLPLIHVQKIDDLNFRKAPPPPCG